MKPEPGEHQHEHHAGKTKAKPAGKVDHVSIVREDPSQRKKRKTKGCEEKIQVVQ